jgi:DNA-binding NarL/FixJ family response regulator
MKSAAMSSKAASVPQAVAAKPIEQLTRQFGALAVTGDRRKAEPFHLTPRQLEVLALLCEGLPNKLICRRLNIAPGTVKVHIGVILRELGAASRLQAVLTARRCGLVDEVAIDTPDRTGEPAGAAQPMIAVRGGFHSFATAY